MKIFFLLSFFTVTSFWTNAQNVGIGTSSPNSSAALDVSSTNKGMLIPRLTTTQRQGISNPAAGLLVFDTDKGTIMFFDGNSWRALTFSDENKTSPQSASSSQLVTNSYFGSTVSISGNYAIIGAPRYGGSGLNNMGLAFIFNKTSSGWKQTARLAAKDSAASDYFGGSVCISGDYAIVGSANKTVGANFAQGKAYVYHRSGSSWLLDTALVKPAGNAYDDFGWAVSVSAYNTGGPGIAVGIPYSDAAGTDMGEIYTYKKSGSTWSFVQNLIPGDLGNSDYYGRAITMDTDYIAVGAPNQDNSTYSYTDAGAVYIYAFGGGVWNFQQKLPGYTANGQFGFSLSLYSNKLAVGAPWAVTYSNTSASVYIYSRTGSTWGSSTYLFIYNTEVMPYASQVQTVSGTGINVANLTFGISVGLYGTTLIIGASGGSDYPNGGSSYYSDRFGTAYIYKNLSGSTFTRANIIQSDFPSNGDLFGESVGVSGTNYIAGGSRTTVNGLINAGSVYFGSQSN